MYCLSSALAVGKKAILGFLVLANFRIYSSITGLLGFLPNPPPPIAIISP